jgi:PKD repeat protein
MKKIVLILALSIGLYQATSAQSNCAYTYTQSGNNVTFSHLWPLALIYTLDSVRFDFGDGNTLLHTLPVPTTTNHSYAAAGTYNACLTRYISQIGVPTPIACTYCDSITIAGTPPPPGCFVNAGFTSSPGAGFTVNFTNTSSCATCLTQSSVWDYGDGNTSTLPQAAHTYMMPGTYTVCLYQIGINSQNVTCIDTFCNTINVSQSSGCTTTMQLASTTNSVTATAFASGGASPYTYSYTLNPGNITNTIGSFTGLTPGVYTVCATATDNNNTVCSVACDTISVGAMVNCTTTIQASVSGNTINASATSTGGTAPYFYAYTLNGGAPVANGSFPGLAPGVYVVCATSFDALQNVCSTDCDTLVVNNTTPSGCIVNAGFTETISGLNVNFTNTSTISNGSITTYGWSFGDGNFSTAPSPVHFYTTPGPYNVVMVVNGFDTSQNACVDSISKTITVSIGSAVNDVKVQELNIYPNPTTKNITIDIPKGEKFENVVITDVSGRKVSNKFVTIDSERLTISLKNRSTGIYFIKLQTNKHIYTSSIMKQE